MEGLAVACRHIGFTEEERQQNLAFGKTNYILNSGFTTVQLKPLNVIFFLHVCFIATFWENCFLSCSHALSFFFTKYKSYYTLHYSVLWDLIYGGQLSHTLQKVSARPCKDWEVGKTNLCSMDLPLGNLNIGFMVLMWINFLNYIFSINLKSQMVYKQINDWIALGC